MVFDELGVYFGVGGFGFDFVGDYWLVGYQQQCFDWDVVGEVGCEQGGSFYVDGYVVYQVQFFFEGFIVFLDLVVGGVYCFGLVVVVQVVDYGGYCMLQGEGWQCWYFWWQVVVGCVFVLDCGDWQDQVVELVFVFEFVVFVQEQYCFGYYG